MCWNAKHVQCKKWQRLSQIPGEDINRLATWIARQDEFESSKDHLGAWNEMVLAPL